MLLETLTLSILNHDSAIASAAARMVTAARGRPILEMGSRRTHEAAAIAASRAAYLAGFVATSNLEAGRRYGVPTSGTSAHAFTLLHKSEIEAFQAQIDAFGTDTTLLVDTYDITQGIRNAVAAAGPRLRAIRIDSGDLDVMATGARELLDELGAHDTKIVVSGDLDEFSIAALAAAPVDIYGAGTAVVVGSGAPTAQLVYKLVEVEGRPVAKRSEHKGTTGGRKVSVRRPQAHGHGDRGGRGVPGRARDTPGRQATSGAALREWCTRPAAEPRGFAGAAAAAAHLDPLGGAETLPGRSGDPGGPAARGRIGAALSGYDAVRPCPRSHPHCAFVVPAILPERNRPNGVQQAQGHSR